MNEQNETVNYQDWYQPSRCRPLIRLASIDAGWKYFDFFEINERSSINDFIAHLRDFVQTSNSLKEPAFFVSLEPETDNQYIFGLVINKKLLLINPLGITEFSIKIMNADLKENKIITNLFLSNYCLQKSHYGSALLIIMELAFNILKNFDQKKIVAFFEQQAKKSKVKEYNSLLYRSFDIKELLPDTLKPLMNTELTEKSYQDIVYGIHQGHCIRQSQRYDSPKIPKPEVIPNRKEKREATDENSNPQPKKRRKIALQPQPLQPQPLQPQPHHTQIRHTSQFFKPTNSRSIGQMNLNPTTTPSTQNLQKNNSLSGS